MNFLAETAVTYIGFKLCACIDDATQTEFRQVVNNNIRYLIRRCDLTAAATESPVLLFADPLADPPALLLAEPPALSAAEPSGRLVPSILAAASTPTSVGVTDIETGLSVVECDSATALVPSPVARNLYDVVMQSAAVTALRRMLGFEVALVRGSVIVILKVPAENLNDRRFLHDVVRVISKWFYRTVGEQEPFVLMCEIEIDAVELSHIMFRSLSHAAVYDERTVRIQHGEVETIVADTLGRRFMKYLFG